MKKIRLVPAGTDGKKEIDVEILPGTQVRDVQNQANMKGFALSKPGGGLFAATDNLYDAVQDGQKVFATKADVEAGA